MSGKYINPFTDFGFKKIFGEEANKDILRDFLNELLREEQGDIKSINFKKNEHIGNLTLDRKAIFDIYCENERGEKFIVEMQKAKHNFFKDRSVFYSTFPIREQAKRGDWNYELNAVYTIAILDFVFDEDKDNNDKFLYKVKLSDIETQKVFYDKLTFIYIEMPKFRKSLAECKNHFERWLYILRNLEKFDRYPIELQEKIFEKLFGVAEVANLTPEQLDEYDESLKVYRDLKGCLDTAFDDGFNEAIKELTPQLEQERQRAEEEKQRAEAAISQIKQQKQVMHNALQSLIDSGMNETDARKILNI
jgi:predicted transposase/invertase (TIGR01784 family)